MTKNIADLNLPVDLQCGNQEFDEYCILDNLVLRISDAYLTSGESWTKLSEVVCIQRIVTLSLRVVNITIRWSNKIAQEVLNAPNLYPFLTVLLCLDSVVHQLGDTGAELDISNARKRIYSYRFNADFFSDVQILLCADNKGQGRPHSLYSAATGELVPRDTFETLVDRLLSSHKGYGISNSKAIFFIKAIGTIVAELFENTEIHGRLGLDGRQIKRNGMRGLIFKRVKILRNGEWRKFSSEEEIQDQRGTRENQFELDALEVSVFDAGVGYYTSYTKEMFSDQLTIEEEWTVVHHCLQRHYDKTVDDTRLSHRAMGLYEVLRALNAVNGLIEVRSGRVYGFRTFVPGDLKFQLEPSDSIERPNMPKPFLLDSVLQYVRKPTPHEYLIGSSVRVLIPL